VPLLETVVKVTDAVRKKIIPSQTLKRAVEGKAEEIRGAVERQSKKAALDAEVRLDGSVAKDTWIRGYVDIDIFMRVSPELTRQQLRDTCLPIARQALRPNRIIERFAEHPYVESFIPFRGEELRVNVVPCYRVEKGNWLSATDRTPYHTQYVNDHMGEAQRDEVRLLKAFMRGIGSYGADIKTGGFSGMLCETLILAFGDFIKTLTEFSDWRNDDFIDIENQYSGREGEVRRIFREPLLVIDPVDRGRNLSAAVRAGQLWNFVAASRSLLEKPRTHMFFEPKTKPLSKAEYHNQIKSRGSTLLCIWIGHIDAVVDILWSQLYRTQRALTNHLENNDFAMIKSAAWSDEKDLNVLLFELESSMLPASKRHEGPPVVRKAESASFIGKHNKKSAVSGPWIEGERWVVQRRRAATQAEHLFALVLRDGGSKVGVAPLITRAFRSGARILRDEQLAALISRNKAFAGYMRTYLSGRPQWLA